MRRYGGPRLLYVILQQGVPFFCRKPQFSGDREFRLASLSSQREPRPIRRLLRSEAAFLLKNSRQFKLEQAVKH